MKEDVQEAEDVQEVMLMQPFEEEEDISEGEEKWSVVWGVGRFSLLMLLFCTIYFLQGAGKSGLLDAPLSFGSGKVVSVHENCSTVIDRPKITFNPRSRQLPNASLIECESAKVSHQLLGFANVTGIDQNKELERCKQDLSKLRKIGANGIVISIPVFSDAWYVRELLENLLAFSLPSTIVVLHYNKKSVFDETDDDIEWLQKHEQIIFNPTRISLKPLTGTYLFSHLLNFEYVSRRMNINRFVLQASNMWWVRPGFEEEAIRHRCTTPRNIQRLSCNNTWRGCGSNFFRTEIAKGDTGWQFHEGSYFTGAQMTEFLSFLMKEQGVGIRELLRQDIPAEESWLPMFVESRQRDVNEPCTGRPMCYFFEDHCGSYTTLNCIDEVVGSKVRTFPVPDDVTVSIEGGHMFAVKRVPRQEHLSAIRDYIRRIEDQARSKGLLATSCEAVHEDCNKR
mmetsp:Transcript_14929/g.29334  ORF Transcript_14929/g.29334 Transcript_14929/m.29334 type:complete len:452 (+) Transcript_14929:64-1419(+)